MEWSLFLGGAYSHEPDGCQGSGVGAASAAGDATGSGGGAGKAMDIELAAPRAIPCLSQHDSGH